MGPSSPSGVGLEAGKTISEGLGEVHSRTDRRLCPEPNEDGEEEDFFQAKATVAALAVDPVDRISS